MEIPAIVPTSSLRTFASRGVGEAVVVTETSAQPMHPFGQLPFLIHERLQPDEAFRDQDGNPKLALPVVGDLPVDPVVAGPARPLDGRGNSDEERPRLGNSVSTAPVFD